MVCLVVAFDVAQIEGLAAVGLVGFAFQVVVAVLVWLQINARRTLHCRLRLLYLRQVRQVRPAGPSFDTRFELVTFALGYDVVVKVVDQGWLF